LQSASVQQAKRGSGGSSAALDALGERIDTLANTLQQETRRIQQKLGDAIRLGPRMEDAEAALEVLQHQLLDHRGEQRVLSIKPTQQPDLVQRLSEDLEIRFSSLQNQTHRLAEECREDMEARIAQVHSSTQSHLSDIRCELESRVGSQRFVDELREDMGKMQSDSQRLHDELRQELETRCAQLQGSFEGFTDELRDLPLPKQVEEQIGTLRQGVEERLDGRIEARMTQTHGLAQRLMNELRQDVEGQVQQIHAVSHQLAKDIRQCTKDTELLHGGFDALRELTEDTAQSVSELCSGKTGSSGGSGDAVVAAFEARIAQVKGAVQRLAEECQESSNDVSILKNVCSDVENDVDSLKAGIKQVRSDTAIAQKLTEDVHDLKALVLQMQGQQNSITSCTMDAVRETVGEAVSALGCRLEEDLAGRCDAGAAGCERIVQEALAKVAVMESQLRAIAADLRTQLAQEGGTLLEALAIPNLNSMRLESGAEPTIAAAAAAREMITAMSPGSRGPIGTPPSTGRPPRSANFVLGATMAERSPHREQVGSVTGTENLDLITQRLHQQERAVEELRQLQASLRGEVDGFLVEHRVSRSLAGLERRSRSPQAFRVANVQEPQGGRRSYSLEPIRITGWN